MAKSKKSGQEYKVVWTVQNTLHYAQCTASTSELSTNLHLIDRTRLSLWGPCYLTQRTTIQVVGMQKLKMADITCTQISLFTADLFKICLANQQIPYKYLERHIGSKFHFAHILLESFNYTSFGPAGQSSHRVLPFSSKLKVMPSQHRNNPGGDLSEPAKVDEPCERVFDSRGLEIPYRNTTPLISLTKKTPSSV